MINWFYLLIGFAITLILEFIVVFVSMWIFKFRDIRKVIGYVLLINLFTWPLAQLFYGIFEKFWIIELFVFIIECILIALLFKIKYWKSFLVSLVANLLSAFGGAMWGLGFNL